VIKGGSQCRPFSFLLHGTVHTPPHIPQTNRKEIAMSNSQEHLSAPDLIEQVIGSGLFSFDDEPYFSYFSWQGCEHCADGLGATVYDLQGYRSLEDRELHDFQICGDCINRLYYGTEDN
jgi:hypothetical protein